MPVFGVARDGLAEVRFSSRSLILRLTQRIARLFFFLNVMRNAFVIIVLTIAAYLYCRTRRDSKGNYPIKILKNVPAGLKHIHTPRLDSNFVSIMAPELPVASIILVLEHIAISKCKGLTRKHEIQSDLVA
jgi:sodium-independent sulfate anion transporter 11